MSLLLLPGVLSQSFGGFSPADLFGAGDDGCWYDPSDLSTMFQNSDGTTAVAVGDPVGYIADKSGNDNHATQATAAARPVLRQTAGGLYYLEFDGVDDRLAFTMTASAEKSVGIATTELTGGGSTQYYVSAPGTQDHLVQIGSNMRWRADETGGTNRIVEVAGAGVDEMQIAIGRIPAAAGTMRFEVNGTENTVAVTQINTFAFNVIGSRDSGAAFQTFSGGMYETVIVDRDISNVETASLRTYLADRFGVTL